jgi:hypothetical protein
MPLSQIKNIAIFQANQGDIEQMIEICAQNLIETNRQKFSSQDFSKKGFLVRRLTFENAKIMIGKQGDDKVKPTDNDVLAIVEPFVKRNEFHFVDPIGIESKIEALTAKIENFKSEVDAVLSESNAITIIEI